MKPWEIILANHHLGQFFFALEQTFADMKLMECKMHEKELIVNKAMGHYFQKVRTVKANKKSFLYIPNNSLTLFNFVF